MPSDESAAPVKPGTGVLGFYRIVAVEVTRRVSHKGLIEAGLLLSYLALRSFDAARTALIGWTAALVGLGLLWPASGLLVLVAVAPFTEWMVLDRTVGKVPTEVRIGMAGQTMQVLDMLELEG